MHSKTKALGGSPNKVPNNLTHLLNISSKFTGTGGNCSSLAPKKPSTRPKPPKTNIFAADNNIETTLFKKYYDRGDLPIAVSFHGANRKITWKLEPELLDYHLYLPIFFEGLRETQEPYKFLATQGTEELLDRGGSKILAVLPQLIIPIKKALGTKNHEIMCATLSKI